METGPLFPWYSDLKGYEKDFVPQEYVKENKHNESMKQAKEQNSSSLVTHGNGTDKSSDELVKWRAHDSLFYSYWNKQNIKQSNSYSSNYSDKDFQTSAKDMANKELYLHLSGRFKSQLFFEDGDLLRVTSNTDFNEVTQNIMDSIDETRGVYDVMADGLLDVQVGIDVIYQQLDTKQIM